MKPITLGILAHVDAGKTTLSESILYTCGALAQKGRVDHKNTFLDTNSIERKRGITVFSKQAVFPLGDYQITLLDTPGHVDFSTETERTLMVLDYALLVINGNEGVQSHTKTLWELLKKHQIPTFLFLNKMDLTAQSKTALLADLRENLDEGCIYFDGDHDEVFYESLALSDEAYLDSFLQTGKLNTRIIQEGIQKRKFFPVYSGSALKDSGIQELLLGLKDFLFFPSYGSTAQMVVYKISRDEKGTRLTHAKITGGEFSVKSFIENEKIDQIRLYSGDKYELMPVAYSGMIVAFTGLKETHPPSDFQSLKPLLTYKVIHSPDVDPFKIYEKFSLLEEEEPTLKLQWQEEKKEILVHVMGEIQTEILKALLQERFQIDIDFSEGSILYKETITDTVIGSGHFEPLRHYAEVHLLMEPAPAGEGMSFSSKVNEDELDKNWQNLILTHLKEKEHAGVLAGYPITDIKITLIAGRAHIKHTSGGDFREATYRALRQGLRKSQALLLEPFLRFQISLPLSYLGRALSDIDGMSGTYKPPITEQDRAVIEGKAPLATIRHYGITLSSYTGGEGKLFLSFLGYFPCHNEKEVLENADYDIEKDSPSSSVFTHHGAGRTIPWDKADASMHIQIKEDSKPIDTPNQKASMTPPVHRSTQEEDAELEEIFIRTYGEPKKPSRESLRLSPPKEPVYQEPKKLEEYLLIDGYNIIYAWDSLKELAEENLDAAREKLIDIISNYQGYKGITTIVVFDAYKLAGHPEEILEYKNLYIVYTKEAETADQYIEKTVHKIGRKHKVTVATSDYLEQIITRGKGSYLFSASELYEEIENTRKEIQKKTDSFSSGTKNYLLDHAPKELNAELENIRLGK